MKLKSFILFLSLACMLTVYCIFCYLIIMATTSGGIRTLNFNKFHEMYVELVIFVGMLPGVIYTINYFLKYVS